MTFTRLVARAQRTGNARSGTRSLVSALTCAAIAASLQIIAVAATSTPAGASGSDLPSNYAYTGSTQTWGPAPSNEKIEVLAVGAAGGSDFYAGSSSTGGNTPGGLGEEELATIQVTQGETLTITVGGKGGDATYPYGGGGGYGGGASGALGVQGGGPGGAGGGGAATVANGSTALVVAGGGGGAGGVDCTFSGTICSQGSGPEFPQLGGAGGSAGATVGAAGGAGQASGVAGGGGGGGGNTTTSSGGAAGSSTCSGTGSGGRGSGGGGGGGCYYNSAPGGGGGGGYYGGGGGGGGGAFFNQPSGGGGGGGGSSYAISGSTAVQSQNGVGTGNGYVVVGAAGTLSLAPLGGPVTAAESGGGGATTECSCVVSAPAGDPVDTMDGDFYESTTDLKVASAGVPLSFVRTYDANVAQTSGSTASGLSPGWTDNLAMSVSLNATTNVATVTEQNGAQVTFKPYSSSVSWCSSSFDFCPSAPRDIATLNQNTDGTWTFTSNLGPALVYTFSSAGALTKVANGIGQSISAAAESPGTGSGASACPSAATSCTVWTSNATTPNPTLTEVFTSGALTAVRGVAATGGTAPNVSFCYYGESACNPPSSGGLTGTLYSATEPGALTTTYGYDATNSSSQYRNDLLTRTNPDGTTLTNVYNASGQVAQQTSPSGAVTTFAYNEIAGAAAGQLPGDATTVSVSPGGGQPAEVSQYDFSYGEFTGVTLDPGSASASSTGMAHDLVSGNVEARTDGNGNVSTTTLETPNTPASYLNAIDPTQSTDALGNTTLYAYTTSNEVWCEVSPAEAANGVSCPSTEPTTAPTPGQRNTVALGVTITYYDAAGYPTYVTDPLGNTTETAYTSAELPWCSVDAAQFTAASRSCPASAPSSAPTGTVTGYTTTLYDGAGDVASVTNPVGATTSYAYTNPSFPDTATQITDPVGDVTNVALDAAGRVVSQTETFAPDGFSQTTVTAYDAAGRAFCTIASVAYAQGHTSCPAAEPASPPAPGSDPWPGAQITLFNGAGQPTYQVNPLGGVSETAFDGAGEPYCNVASADYAQGATCPAPGAAWVAGVTLTQYDALGRVVQVTNPLGGITLTSYDAAGNVLQTTTESNNPTADPNVVTSNTYDADNRVTSTTVDPGGPLAATTERSYDPNGHVFCSVSANAVGTGGFQCPAWQPGWIAVPPSPVSLYSSTPSAFQAKDVTMTFFDANGNQVQSSDPDVHTQVGAFDADGRAYCSADPTNVGAWLATHQSGTYPYLCPASAPATPPAQGSHPGYTTTILDPAGQKVSSTDQVGDTTTSTYDLAGNVLTTTDPTGEVTTNCYYWQNASGLCAHGAPTGGGAAVERYSTRTPATAADPQGELTTMSYDPGGLAATTSTPAGTSTDAYDAAGDLTSTSYSNTASGYATPANVAYTYNADRTRATMSDGTGTTTYGYDGNGDVTAQSLVAKAGSGLRNTATSYGYFDTGVLASVTYPPYVASADPMVNYSYDATGAMASETDWQGNQVTFAHDADGNQTGQNNAVSSANPNGTSSTAFSYDPADNMNAASSTLAQSCGGSETLTQAFSGSGGSRNADGQVTSDSESFAGSCSNQASHQSDYSYDPAGRVIYQGSSPQGSNGANFGYDPSGDPTNLALHDGSGAFDSYTQRFDAAGEVTGQTPVSGSGGSSATYSYDTLGDQTNATSGSSSSSYAFDANGRMTSATTAAGMTTYLDNGDGLEAAAKYPGDAWGTPTSIDGSHGINAVSCASSTFCEAVDNGGNALAYRGSGWSAPTSVDSTTSISSVSCPSATFCAAVDSSGEALTFNGTSWSPPLPVDPLGLLGLSANQKAFMSVSCVSASFCAAVDGDGLAFTYNGTLWSLPYNVGTTSALTAVSCSSATSCVATDATGDESSYNGSTWSTPMSIDATRSISAVSCPSSTFCAAVDTSGYAVTFNGTSWSQPNEVDASHQLNSISCASSSKCTAVDASGSVVSFNGAVWSYPQTIDASRTLGGISCVSSSMCAAVDGSGYALLYGPATLTSQLTWNKDTSLLLILSDGLNDYVYGPSGTPVEQVNLTTPVPTFMTFTPSDSSWLTTNAAGDATGFWRYDAFGTLAFGTPTSAFGYGGQYTDASSGLSNLRARWYQPQTGGFTSRDPAFSQTDTAYTYAGDDPVNKSDPSGLETVGLCGSASLGAGFFKQVFSAVGMGQLNSQAYFGSICEVHTVGVPADEWALTATGGYSYNKSFGGWAGISGAVQLSTASHVNDLSGPFTLAQASYDVYTGDVFWGGASSPSSPNAVFGVDLGGGISFGAGVAAMTTQTVVFEATNWFAKQTLEWAWRLIGGGAADAAAKLIGTAVKAAKSMFLPAGAATIGSPC